MSRMGCSGGPRPPDIVVEVITAKLRDQRRDRIDEKADHATLGGKYWLVDSEARTFEILARNADGRFVEVLAADAVEQTIGQLIHS